MRKALFVVLILGCSLFASSTSFGQTFTTESKNCGACKREVSIHSRVGMTCPHCGVRWGAENETRTTRSETEVYYNTKGYTTSTANLRSAPSKKGSILMVLPAWTSLTIMSRTGDWYNVQYSYFDMYLGWSTINGYVHKSLIK